ncbi:BZ3500_MvSof-1268-A1-R1_Chr1-1g01101 [Microbotryum saponariae]|uniref:BZ3500_MvSof-1268-A1-R1_Chr1-1g01101 protein n=1 Tax=Microbotryum saponariae TaxID=289078 RepID=A0A2X0MDP5_9BASI|nr:BZ3500_MvSof-1268-A1-R1_Chr1-1g01101 [Microbotryum saponariae]SCZ93386.1 BZ3501_MvSof-1269-A2-R1_Chr1-1g00698 [Microbotryum saponariae]
MSGATPLVPGMAIVSGSFNSSSCRHPECGCPEYEPPSSDAEQTQHEHIAHPVRTVDSTVEATANLRSVPLTPRRAWLLSACGTCEHYTGWHKSPIHLTSTQANEMRERDGDALEFCKAKTTEGKPCPCPAFVPKTRQRQATMVCALCECKKGWHKYKQDERISRATVESQENTAVGQVASLPSLIPEASFEVTANQDLFTSGSITIPPLQSASAQGKRVDRTPDESSAMGSSPTNSPSTITSDAVNLLIPNVFKNIIDAQTLPSPIPVSSTGDDAEGRDGLSAQQTQAKEMEHYDLDGTSRVGGSGMREDRQSFATTLTQPLDSMASPSSTSTPPIEELAPTTIPTHSVQYGIAVTTPRAISNYSPSIEPTIRDVGIYSAKSMKLAVEPAIANNRTWAPGQKFDMRLKLDDSVSKADFEVLECKIFATIAINSITLDRHQCAMTRVGILPVQSSSVNAPNFNERCFYWTLTLPVESTCGCLPRCPAPSTYSHSGFYVDWVLELTAKKKGLFGGKNEKLVLHFNVAAQSSGLESPVRSLDDPSEPGSTGWRSIFKEGLRYEIEGTSRCIVEPRIEYRSCRTIEVSSSPTSKSCIKIHYRISAPLESISALPIVAFWEPPSVPGASQQHIVRLERTAQLIKRTELGVGVAKIDCAAVHQTQVVMTSPEDELSRAAADSGRRWWRVEGYLVVPSNEMRDLRSCRAAVQFRLKVTIPFRGWVRCADVLQLPQPMHWIDFEIPDMAMPPLFVHDDDSVTFDAKANGSSSPGQSMKPTLTSSSGAFVHDPRAEGPDTSGSAESKKVRENMRGNTSSGTTSQESFSPTSPTSPSKSSRRGSFFSRLLSNQEHRVQTAVSAPTLPPPNSTIRNTAIAQPSGTPLQRARSAPSQMLENPSRTTPTQLPVQARLPTFDELHVEEEVDAPPPTFEEATEEDSRYVWERIMQRLED